MNLSLPVSNKIAVLIVSCDKSSDVWELFFNLFRRFWGDCPFKVYFLSNRNSPHIHGVTDLLVGEDISWSDNLLIGLEQISEEYIFMLLEDLFLCDFVNNTEVIQVFEWASSYGANCVKMNCYGERFHLSRLLCTNEFNDFAKIIPPYVFKAQYRVSTVATLWKKEFLKILLKPGESAWQFEKNGQKRSSRYGNLFLTKKNYFPIANGVMRGKWRPRVVKRLNEIGVFPDLKTRNLMSLRESLYWDLKDILHTSIMLIEAQIFEIFSGRSFINIINTGTKGK